jgi:glyoxylase-like metal-dependent hydrolase (beta-lactamase superfamily II)
MRPGDSRRFPIVMRISAYPDKDEFAIAVRDSGDTTSHPDVWYVRGSRVTRSETAGVETADAPLGDLSPEALGVIHPAMFRGHRARIWEETSQVVSVPGRTMDELRERRPGDPPGSLRHKRFDERLGDGEETVAYAYISIPTAPDRVVTIARRNGIEVAQLTFNSATQEKPESLPPAGQRRIDVEDHNTVHQLAPGQVDFTEIVPHVFAIDLDSLNTRVTVAEFSDSLVVLEGAYGSVVCDALADAIRARFHKPVRMFAFSHLHAQYSGGTRSWVHEGATIVVPPSTEPLIRQMVAAPFKLRPDALEREPKPLHILTVPQHLHVEDSMNALDIYNVESGHTDEYFLFHFPRQKVLLTGDLMFLRPGKPFSGRSKQLCATVAKLGLDVDTYVATWPLNGYGTKPIVTREEFQAACEAAK